MRSEPFGVARTACFEELADVFASSGALHYAKILASLKIKKGISSHKKCHFFVRGFQIMDQKRHFEPQTAILAKKWLDSFARIAGCFFCRSKNMASSPYRKDDKTKFTNLPFPLIQFCPLRVRVAHAFCFLDDIDYLCLEYTYANKVQIS